MNTYIVLFRGINIGGRHIVPMKELKVLLENLGYYQVKTYIQSGNVILQSDEKEAKNISQAIQQEIKKKYGFELEILILTKTDVENAIQSNPFPEGELEPSTLHLIFLISPPQNPAFDKLEKIKKDSEKFELRKKVFYLYAPEGVARSKLAANIERSLGVPTTGRNWRTVKKILEMSGE